MDTSSDDIIDTAGTELIYELGLQYILWREVTKNAILMKFFSASVSIHR